ncbi:MAG: transketolase C-terminal domain-containing protein [Bacteroidales bacterium]|nr:transketolase C-terminal domain-containing protein [Bacteroidales bacterium]
MKSWSCKALKATKEGFGEGLIIIGEKNPDVIAIGADITASVSVNGFAKKFPQRFYSIGIAEQNGIAIAAGMALSGKLPVFASYATFAVTRALDQIRISLCYNDVHAIIGGAHAGISVGPDGATHQALEDIAMMRVLPNMIVLSPCDATQTKLAVMAAEQCQHPVYIRFGRDIVPDFTDDSMPFTIGKAQCLKEGNHVAILATGHLTWESLQAAFLLEKDNIHARVINFHTIKPIDKQAIIDASTTGLIVTAEEHQTAGGFGSAVAEVVVENCPTPMLMIGVHDRFGESGPSQVLMEKFGLTAVSIAQKIKTALSKQ